jgi:hypothetical protein
VGAGERERRFFERRWREGFAKCAEGGEKENRRRMKKTEKIN